MEIMLGCRPRENSEYTEHCSDLAPLKWKSAIPYPQFSDSSDSDVDERLARDLPSDENDLDTILESLMGLEYAQVCKRTGNRDLRRRMLVIQWLYVHGFLDEDFPPRECFIPHHINSPNDWQSDSEPPSITSSNS
jgi:hypothetical protein